MRSKKMVLSLGLLAMAWMVAGAAAGVAADQAASPATAAASVAAPAPAAPPAPEPATAAAAPAAVFEIEAGPVSCPARTLSIGLGVMPAVALASGLCACSETLGCSGVNVGAACTTPNGKPGHCFAVPRFCSPGTDTCRCQ
jgi:hypothetical protein